MVIPFVVFLSGNMAILYYGIKTNSVSIRILCLLIPIVFNVVYFLIFLQVTFFSDSGFLGTVILVFSFFFGWMSPLLLLITYASEYITGRKLGQPKSGDNVGAKTENEN